MYINQAVLRNNDMQLMSAVCCGNVEAVEEHLKNATSEDIFHALMTSIYLGHEAVSAVIIRNGYYDQEDDLARRRKFPSLRSNIPLEIINSGQLTSSEYATTPLIFAVLRNQVNIVQLLVSKGERIEEPHPLGCHCESCNASSDSDELHIALTRLNTYRALCNEIYIISTSPDPILTAFELSKKMTNLASTHWNFSSEYNSFADNLRQFSADLINCVCNGDEQKTILKRGAGRGLKKNTLARLKLAIHYKHKQFVTHWICQEKLAQQFFDQYYYVDNYGTIRKAASGLLFVVCYPIAVLLYMLWPCKSKISRFVETPVIKCASAIASYIVFMLLVILLSSNRKSSEGYRLSEHRDVGPIYLDYCNRTISNNQQLIIQDVFIRPYSVNSALRILLPFWVLGLAWQTVTNFLHERSLFLTNPYNVIDIISHFLYLSSIGLEAYCLKKVSKSLSYFGEAKSWRALEENDTTAMEYLYYLDADRHSWSEYDLSYISDCIFAIASVLTVCRLTYVLAFHRKIGPLVVSLSQMAMEVFWFMFLLLLLIFAFVIGIQNIHWYYSRENRAQAELGYDKNVADYGQFYTIFKNLLFSLFGFVELDSAIIKGYNSEVVNLVFLVLFACFDWVMIIILLNILVARMSERYDDVADQENIEWSFFATMLMLEYMRDDDFLCVPFNIIPSPRGAVNLFKKMIKCCKKDAKKEAKYEEKEHFEVVMDRIKERFMQRHFSSSGGNNRPTNSALSLYRVKSSSTSKNKSIKETDKERTDQSWNKESTFTDKRRSDIWDHVDNTHMTNPGEIVTINNKVDKLTDKLASLELIYRQESVYLRTQMAELMKTLNTVNAPQLISYNHSTC